MVKKEELIKVAKVYADRLKKHPKVDLIFIHGSIPENVFDEHSDIDLQIYTKKLTSNDVKKLFELVGLDLDYKKFKPPFFRFVVKEKGREISMNFAPFDLYKWPMKNDNLNPFVDETLQKNILSYVINIIVLFDRNKLISRYKQLKELPKNFQKHYLTYTFNKLLYYFGKEAKSFELNQKRNNKLAMIRAFENSNERILKVLYALNNKFLLNEKWVTKYIGKFPVKPKNCLKRLEVMMALGFNQFSKKRKLYEEFVKDLQPLVQQKLKAQP